VARELVSAIGVSGTLFELLGQSKIKEFERSVFIKSNIVGLYRANNNEVVVRFM
jgi:hypothetical protein